MNHAPLYVILARLRSPSTVQPLVLSIAPDLFYAVHTARMNRANYVCSVNVYRVAVGTPLRMLTDSMDDTPGTNEGVVFITHNMVFLGGGWKEYVREGETKFPDFVRASARHLHEATGRCRIAVDIDGERHVAEVETAAEASAIKAAIPPEYSPRILGDRDAVEYPSDRNSKPVDAIQGPVVSGR